MTQLRTAVLLAAGKGTRLRPLTYTRPKVLVPVAGKPLLEHNLERLAACGVTRVVVVVGDDGQAIQEAIGAGVRWGVEVCYVRQPKPLGTAHALQCAAAELDGGPFLFCFGDNMTPFDLTRLIARHLGGGHVATLCVKRSEQPSRHGVVEVSGPRVVGLEEKPERPKSELTMAGMYVCGPETLTALAETPRSAGGEYYFPDTLQRLLDGGASIGYVECTEWRTNVNDAEELLTANRLVLDAALAAGERSVRCGAERPNHIPDSVAIGDGARVGPYVSLGPEVRLGRRVELRNCILLERVQVGDGAKLSNAVLAEDTTVAAGFATPPGAPPRLYTGAGESLG